MKIEKTKNGTVILKEVFSGILLETSEGNQIAICMRDDTFEINVLPAGARESTWHRVNMKTASIDKEFKPSSQEVEFPTHYGRPEAFKQALLRMASEALVQQLEITIKQEEKAEV